MRRTWLIALLPATALTLASCAEEVKDVNRVQPDYYPKDLLKGDWYYRQTIVDVPPDVGIAFVGLEGKVEKVNFEFAGDRILAHRTHESIQGLDEDETRPGADFQGELVFKVSGVRQFDILRDFNTANGQQGNVLDEDTSLHPEWERKYFRADWASATGVGPVDFAGLFSGGPRNPQGLALNTYFVPESNYIDPDHLQVDLDGGTISFTQDFTTTDGGYTCFLQYGFYRSTTNTRNDCGVGTIKVRHSFVRIDPKEELQFEPRSYLDREQIRDTDGKVMRVLTVSVPKADGGSDYVDMECTPEVLAKLGPTYSEANCHTLQLDQMGRFGFFRTENYAANRRVPDGHDELRHFYANHHSIWQQPYQWEMTRDADGNSVVATDENGKPKLKTDKDGNPVPVPVKQRKVKPIVYYLNVNFPEDLKVTAQEVAKEWDDVFVAAIASAKGVTETALRAELKADTGKPSVFRIEDNTCTIPSVKDYLDRNPDLQDAADLATHGEALLAGNIERVCSALTHESRARGAEPFTYQQVGDVRWNFAYWINEDQPEGPLGFGPSGPDPQNGRIISGNAYVYGAAIDGYARESMDIVRFLNGDISEEDDYAALTSGQTVTDWLKNRHKSVADEALTVTDEVRQDLKRRFSPYAMKNPGKVQGLNGQVDLVKMTQDMSARALARDPADPINGQAGAPDPRDVMRQRLRENPELLSRMTPAPMKTLLSEMFQWDEAEHPGEDMPKDMQDAAIELAANPNAIAEHMQKRAAFYMDRNITLPEFIDDAVVGRAIQLKGHPPEEVYTMLRKEIFKGVILHEIGHTLGMTHNFRASADALNYFDQFWEIQDQYDTDADRDDAEQPEFRYASIMDYGARFNSDLHGLGKYDRAAIKFAYTGLMESFADDVTVPGRLDLALEYGDYKKIPDLLGGSSDLLTHRKDVPIADYIDARRDQVRHNGQRFLTNPKRDPADYDRDRTVPYFYCIDWFNGRDPKCRTWDEGPTHEEAVRSAIQRYWNYYFFNSWRRGRDDYQFQTGFFSRMGRLLPYLSYPYKYYAYFQQYQNRDATPMPLTEDLLRAAMLTTNFMIQVMGTPEPGWYCLANTPTGIHQELSYLPYWLWGQDWTVYNQDSCHRWQLPVGVGRNQYMLLSDDYRTKVNYMGSFYDKLNFMMPLLDAGRLFVRPPETLDGEIDLRFGYYDVFKDRLLDLSVDLIYAGFGQIGHRMFQWKVDSTDDTDRQWRFPSFFDFKPLNAGLQGSDPENLDEVQIWVNTPFDLTRQFLFQAAQLNSRPADQKLDFYQYVAVQEEGSGDDRALPADAEIEVFENPKTGQTFRAAQTSDGHSIAYRILKTAKGAALSWKAARAALDADPENPTKINDLENADQTLEFYLSTVDDMRFLRSFLDKGK